MQRHATLLPLRDEALRDDPKNGCEGDEGGGRLRDSNHRGSSENSSRHIYFSVENLSYAISKSVPALELRPLRLEGSAITTGTLLLLPMVCTDGVTGGGSGV